VAPEGPHEKGINQVISVDRIPIGAMKILSCYREVQTVLAGKMPVPRTMEFFLSNTCNHACVGCHSRYLHKADERFLDFDKLKEVVADIARLGVEGVEISGGGEPLMYPDIIPAIAYMRSKGLKVGMFTNGTLLNPDLSEFLVENLLFLRVAVDAGNRETYRKIHGRDDFEKLKDNLRHLVELGAAKDHGKKFGTATVGAKYLVSTRNWRELSDAAEMARDIGLDYLQFKVLRNSKFTPEGEELEQAALEAAKAEALVDDDFQVFGSLEKTKVIGRCILNPIHPVIDATGNMYLCAFFHHRKESHCIGNIYEKSFPRLWYSERHFEAFRSTKPKECAIYDCPFHEAAVLARAWIVENRKHLEFI
jgi:cyclic pyranopterin phosphate synthase